MGLLSGLFTRRGVRFVRVYTETRSIPPTGEPGVLTYELYAARSARRARDFLNGVTVSEQLYRVVVETPEGDWGKSSDGLYKV